MESVMVLIQMHQLGGKVEKAPVREYGKIEVNVDTQSKLFKDVSSKTICWMSHNDYIAKEAPGFKVSAWTKDCPVAAVENPDKKSCMQFSSIQKCFTPRKEQKRCLILYTRSAAAQETGKWILL